MARAVGAATSLRSVGLARRQVISHRQWATADVHHLAPPRHHCRCGLQCGSQLQLHAPTCLAPTRALVECWRCVQWEIVAVPTPTAIRSSARNRQAAQLAVARNNNVHRPALPRRASVSGGRITKTAVGAQASWLSAAQNERGKQREARDKTLPIFQFHVPSRARLHTTRLLQRAIAVTPATISSEPLPSRLPSHFVSLSVQRCL